MKIFISGSRSLNHLDDKVKERLNNICNSNYTVLIGDAYGIDEKVQEYLSNQKYKNVYVFASQGKARNNLGNWNVINIKVDKRITGFQFYAEKDKAMAYKADYGFVIWDCQSRGSLNNIVNLANQNKKTLVYLQPQKKFVCINKKSQIDLLISHKSN